MKYFRVIDVSKCVLNVLKGLCALPCKDTNTHLGDSHGLFRLGLTQTLVEASTDDVLQDLPGVRQLRG